MTGSNRLFDAVVIGAGIAGAAAARELCRYRLSVAVVEQAADVCCGVTKSSHAFVHCGVPAPESPLRNHGELAGNRMMKNLCRDLDVPFKTVGKLLVAFDDAETAALHDLAKRLIAHGVTGVEVLPGSYVRDQMEPCVSERVVAALHTPTTGVTNPWSLVFGLMENAVANGCRLYLNAPVTGIRPRKDGSMAVCAGSRTIAARRVINAAGADAGKLARMIGDRTLAMEYLKMQRVILDRNRGRTVARMIRGLDQGDPVGDFVAPTADGNLMVGSTVEWVDDPTDDATSREGIQKWVLPAGRRLVPALADAPVIRPFSGAMPMAGADFRIGPSETDPRLIHFVLGASGLTAAVPMAEHLVRNILPDLGLVLEENARFLPRRSGIARFQDMTRAQRGQRIAQNPAYGRIVCRCEAVSEAEITAAIDRGAVTRDGIKFRTRAGMGRCQGNFCGHKLLEILGRRLGQPLETLTRRGNGSFELHPPPTGCGARPKEDG